jgi:hypothetical protein
MLAAYQIGLFRQCWTQNREFPFACRRNPYRPTRLGAREAQPPLLSATVPIASTTHVGQAHADDSLPDQTGSVNRPRSRIFDATSLWLSVYNAALLASPIMIVDQGHQEYRLPRGSTSG